MADERTQRATEGGVDTGVDADEVRRVVEGVADPELPPVTLGMLGMVHEVSVSGTGMVHVELLPTYSGCPATEMIERDVRAAVSALEAVTAVEVGFSFDPPWTPDRIDAEGRAALREYGIAPPGGPLVDAPRPGHDQRSLPLAVDAATSTSQPARPCPYCGSHDTEMDSPFGPTPCRDVRYCQACQQPFEAFRSA
ncbi:MAG: 1,2-phenylacetyl-CoA epoxidase subunit PaaD [Nitriliruptoraceae bacterium]